MNVGFIYHMAILNDTVASALLHIQYLDTGMRF